MPYTRGFEEITIGKTIIMGYNTFVSLGRVLPNRKHIVLTSRKELTHESEQVEFVHSIDDLKDYIDDENEHFIIGGASIYKQLMQYANKMYITEIDEEFEADTFFPEISKEEWKEVEREKGLTNEQNPYMYEYVTYVRK